MNYKKYYLTSESVTEGHPDKVCDFISDSILDACLEQDENSRVAIETFISNGKVVVAGQITSNAIIDVENIVREKLKEVGYDDARYNMDYRTCDIDINIAKQSGDIAMGVDTGGAGDQGIMFGFACNETDNYMPYAIDTAHKLAQRLTQVRKEGIIPYLKSDGKVQVTIEYLNDVPFRIDRILISIQHTEDTDMDILENDIIEYVIKPVVEDDMLDAETKILINPTGRFVVEDAIKDCYDFSNVIDINDYGDVAKYKKEILERIYRDERVADVNLDRYGNLDMVFYTDFCPYYFDLDTIIDNNYIIDPFSEIDMLQEFGSYYAEKCLFDNPYISIRNLINQFVETQTDNKEKREVLSNIIKMKLNESDFLEKNIDGIEVYVTPKNYKELEEVIKESIGSLEQEELE